MNSTCVSWGHRYVARYDVIPPDLATLVPRNAVEWKMSEGMVEKLTKQIYVCDVCSRCGDQVNR